MSQPNQRPDRQNLPDNAPYPGLRPYSEEESGRFFGRDADARILLDKLLAHRLTLLFAATGVGKSSLLRASVIPQLKSPRGKNLDVVYYNDWISPPLEGLKAEIEKTLHESGSWPQDVGQNIDPKLSLNDFLEFCTLFTHHPLVIMLDQFEELFRYRKQYHQQTFKPFIDQLTALITATHIPVSLVFSMREDFALELNAFKPKLPTLLFENYYRLERLTAKSAREAVLTPAQQIGFRFEQKLLDQLISDLLSRDLDRDPSSLATDEEAETVEPPYLQIVCSQLWEREKNNADSTFHLNTYIKAGGAKGLLTNYVQGVLKNFSDSEKQVASKAFDHLISRRGTKMAHTPPDLAELVRIKEDDLRRVLDKLAHHRVLRTQQRGEKTWYELYHDMFSNSIEDWNSKWKIRRRTQQIILATTSSLLLAAGIYFAFLTYLQSTNKHLRLGNSPYDRIEIYSGTSKYFDPFNQQHYLYETYFHRFNIELDKTFTKQEIQNFEELHNELTTSLPLNERIAEYRTAGNFCQLSKLFTAASLKNPIAPGCQYESAQNNKTAISIYTDKNNNNIFYNNFLNDAYLETSKIRTLWGFDLLQNATINDSYNTSSPAIIQQSLNLPIASKELESLLNKMDMTTFQGSISDPRIQHKLKEKLINNDEGIIQAILSVLPGSYYDYSAYNKSYDYSMGEDQQEIAASVFRNMLNTPEVIKSLKTAIETGTQDQAINAINLLANIEPKLTQEAISIALGNMNRDVREYAKSTFERTTETHLNIISTINDTSLPIYERQSAINKLGPAGKTEDIPFLLNLLKDQKNREEIRLSALGSLGQIGDDIIINELSTILKNPQESTRIRISATETIGTLGNLEVSPLLQETALNQEELIDIRKAAVSALGNLEDHNSLSTLFNLLATSKNKLLSHEIVNALGQIGDSKALKPLNDYLSTLNKDSILHRVTAINIEILNNTYVEEGYIYGPTNPRDNIIISPPIYNTKNPPRKRIMAKWENVSPQKLSVNTSSYNYSAGRNQYGNDQGYYYGTPRINSGGKRIHKQALLAAINTDDIETRNLLLSSLITSNEVHSSIRIQATENLEPYAAFDTQAIEDITHSDKAHPLLKNTVLDKITKIKYGTSLIPYFNDENLPIKIRKQAIYRFFKTSEPDSIINEFKKTINNQNHSLRYWAFHGLGALHNKETLPLLEDELEHLEQEYDDWRNIRDDAPADAVDEQLFSQWQEKMQKHQPKHAIYAKNIGYLIAQIDTDKGIELLKHNISDVRDGAVLALGTYTSVNDLIEIDALREEQKTNDPMFYYYSYRLLDQRLLLLEQDASEDDLQKLQEWYINIKNRPISNTVKQRLEWTIKMIKHYQQLDKEFNEKHGLKRVIPKNNLPLNPFDT